MNNDDNIIIIMKKGTFIDDKKCYVGIIYYIFLSLFYVSTRILYINNVYMIINI